MTRHTTRTTQHDLTSWLTAQLKDPDDIDETDMLAYIHEWEDAHPEMVESPRARELHQAVIADAWRKAFGAARVSFDVLLES